MSAPDWFRFGKIWEFHDWKALPRCERTPHNRHALVDAGAWEGERDHIRKLVCHACGAAFAYNRGFGLDLSYRYYEPPGTHRQSPPGFYEEMLRHVEATRAAAQDKETPA